MKSVGNPGLDTTSQIESYAISLGIQREPLTAENPTNNSIYNPIDSYTKSMVCQSKNPAENPYIES